MARLAKNLPRVRKQKKMTQTELARAVGIARSTVAKYEAGFGGATFDTVAQLAKVLSVEETDLVAVPEDSGSEFAEQVAARVAKILSVTPAQKSPIRSRIDLILDRM